MQFVAAALLAAALAATGAEGPARYGEAPPARVAEDPMERMLEAIAEDASRTAAYTGIERISPAVLDALRATPRDLFVPPRSRGLAYANHPLPIGHGQTISQPFIVAIMTELLALQPHHHVLEIGTGSGYQAAVLAPLASRVLTVEIVPALAASATDRLAELGYANVEVRQGDGWRGWPEEAPFDGIVVTAVAERIPPPLIEQLASGGRLVMPLGPADGFQELVVYHKGDERLRRLFPVRFVPLTGGP